MPQNNMAAKQQQFKVRSIQTPVVDQLDPSQPFLAQMRKATKGMNDEDADCFKKVQDSLVRAKKEKLNAVRDAQKQLAATKQQEEQEAAALMA